MVILTQNNQLAQGISQFGSALGQALGQRGQREYNRQEKLAENQRQVELENQKRQRIQQSGTILQNVLSQVGENPSIQQLQSALSLAIQQGADPSIVQNFAQQFAPIFKEQAKLQGAESFYNKIMGGGATPTSGFQATEEISSPGGTVYEQIDGVPNGITQEKIDALIASPYPQFQALGKQYEARRQEARKNFNEDRNFHTKGLAETEKKIESLREVLPKRKRVLNLARNAIESGEIGSFSRNRIADMIGGPIGDALRTKSGAQFGLAAKENLVTGMSEISARGINMFMEKRLLDAFSKVGQSEEANLAVQDFLEAENAIDEAYLKEYDRLAQQDMEKFGYKRNDLAKRAREAAEPEREKIFNRSSLRNRRLQERENGIQWMYKQTSKKVDKGTPLTSEMYGVFIEKIGNPEDALKRAKQLGYKIYSPSEIAGGTYE